MKSHPSLLTKFGKVYDTYKKWIIYVDLFLILVLSYLGDFLGPLREVLLPAAVVSILAVFFETIQSLEATISMHLKPKEFSTLTEAISAFSEIVSRDKNKTTIAIIATAGGTTITHILPGIIRSSSASSIEISLHLINPNSIFAKWFPPHWPQEAQTVIKRIPNEISGDRIRINVYTYDNLPALHGIMINKTHLILGFMGWTRISGRIRLSVAEKPHLYFVRKEPGSEYFFDLFDDWFEHVPCQLVYRFPEGALKQRIESTDQ